MWPLYAFDNYFLDTDRIYSLDEQWEMVRAIGYDLAYCSVNRANEAWSKVEELPARRLRTGLGLAAAYALVDLHDPHPPGHHSVEEVIDKLEPGDVLELALTVGWQKDLSLPVHDDLALRVLGPMLSAAKANGVIISLYHHFGFWMERIEDCVRLAGKMQDFSLRVSFCAYHWYARDRKDLAGKLGLAKPWLVRVNLCGSRPSPEGFAQVLPATIEPVGDGNFPLVELVEGLQTIDYKGPVGFLGYKIGGVPAQTLERSLKAFCSGCVRR